MTPDRPRWTDQVVSDVEAPKQGEFTPAQKRWLERAWREYCHGHIPDVFAVHAVKCGEQVSSWTLSPDQKYHWHHIVPGPDATAHDEISELPENGIPLPGTRHIGPDDDAIHPDVSDAKSLWRYHRQNLIPNPFLDLSTNHTRATEQGIPYWDTSYDVFFRELAEKVVTAYKADHPDHPWPVRIPRSHPARVK